MTQRYDEENQTGGYTQNERQTKTNMEPVNIAILLKCRGSVLTRGEPRAVLFKQSLLEFRLKISLAQAGGFRENFLLWYKTTQKSVSALL